MILYRVDDRLIHGQVTYSWVTQYSIDYLIIVNDEFYHDEFKKMVMMSSGDISMRKTKVLVYSVEMAAKEISSGKFSDKNLMLIFTIPIDVLNYAKAGNIKIDELNLGDMQYREGRKLLSKSLSSTVYINKDELESLKEMQAMGVKLFQQILAKSEKRDIDIEKFSF